ncbi:MAG TPA: DUF2306 domain-containing protein [Burkholderiales bacterium]|nr:DUF2306 domain-containing protein [Burkholderiales bacterium]
MQPLIVFHLAFALAALALGGVLLVRRKGTASHKVLGRIWASLMAVVALSSFWIFEIRHGAGPSFVHLLSVWTLISLACAIYFIRRGNVRAHRGFMIGTFLGLAGAGAGALAPGRALYRLFFA